MPRQLDHDPRYLIGGGFVTCYQQSYWRGVLRERRWDTRNDIWRVEKNIRQDIGLSGAYDIPTTSASLASSSCACMRTKWPRMELVSRSSSDNALYLSMIDAPNRINSLAPMLARFTSNKKKGKKVEGKRWEQALRISLKATKINEWTF